MAIHFSYCFTGATPPAALPFRSWSRVYLPVTGTAGGEAVNGFPTQATAS